jgi:CBS domain-containing protein
MSSLKILFNDVIHISACSAFFKKAKKIYKQDRAKISSRRVVFMPLTLRVRDVLEGGVVMLDENRTAMEALKAMIENNVWSVVVTVRGIPTGVVTEHDILRRAVMKGLDLDKVRLKDIMSCPLITIGPDASFGEVWKLMVEKNIRRVYVVEEGKIIGRVTRTGLFQKLLDAVLALASLKTLM